MADEKPKAGAKDAKKGGGLGWLSFIFGAAVAAAFFGATMTVLIAGMLPTIIALITDRSAQKHQAIAMSVLNFAGVLPFVFNLWQSGKGMTGAVQILADPVTWLAMFGAAGIGWAIYNYVPKIIVIYAVQRAESGIAERKSIQQRLIRKWGDKVTSNKHISQLEER